MNNYVSTNPTLNQYASSIVSDDSSDSSGMPVADGTPAPPANIDISDPDTTATNSGFVGTLESWGSSAVNAVESGVKTVYGGVKTVVGDTVGGAENLVTSTASSFTGDILLVLGVVVVGLVLLGKSGAFKATI